MAAEGKWIAVTGAGGFIGSHLVEELLAAGHKVRALVHYNALGSEGHLSAVRRTLTEAKGNALEVVAGDVTDARCMASLVRGCSHVYHLAALIGIPYSYTAPQSYVNVNVQGTLNVLEACRNESVERLIHTSTSEVYGTALTTPMDESHPLQAQSPYSATKIAADKLVESYVLSFGLPAVTVRPFNTYGPRQSLRAVLPTIIAQAVSPECSTIQVGSLDPVRDLTFAGDTARGFRMVGEATSEAVIGKVFNLGTGSGISIGELAELVKRTLGCRKEIVSTSERVRPTGSEVRLLLSNNGAVRDAVGWKPETSLEAGIRATSVYIQENLHLLRPGVYTR